MADRRAAPVASASTVESSISCDRPWGSYAAVIAASFLWGSLLVVSVTVKLLLLYVGIGCTAMNFTLWFYGLQRLPSAQASAFQFLIPPIGVALSSLALGEFISVGLIVGGGLILGGLVMTQVGAPK